MVNFGTSKPGVRGDGQAPPLPDPHLRLLRDIAEKITGLRNGDRNVHASKIICRRVPFKYSSVVNVYDGGSPFEHASVLPHNVKTLLPTKKTTDVYSASHGPHRFSDKRAV